MTRTTMRTAASIGVGRFFGRGSPCSARHDSRAVRRRTAGHKTMSTIPGRSLANTWFAQTVSRAQRISPIWVSSWDAALADPERSAAHARRYRDSRVSARTADEGVSAQASGS